MDLNLSKSVRQRFLDFNVAGPAFIKLSYGDMVHGMNVPKEAAMVILESIKAICLYT